MGTPTNISQVSNSVLLNAFNPLKEEDFLSNSLYPRYSSPDYLKVIPANLEDNPEIETINIVLKELVYAPITLTQSELDALLAADDITGATRIIPNYTYSMVPTTKSFSAVRKLASSTLLNPIQVINNRIDLNKSFDIGIELLVKYTQEFKIPAGSKVSNVFEILNQNTEYDKNFYITLNPETLANIGNITNYNNLYLRNYRATYNNDLSANGIIEVNKWYMGISNTVAYDIVGTCTTYTSISIPKNTTHFFLPVMRSSGVENYNTNGSSSFEIISINTGRFNILEMKSEPLTSGGKSYDRLVLFSDNKNISGTDLTVKIQNIKNILIPRGEIQGSYTYGLINTLPSITTSSPVTSIGNFNPYDYSTTIVNMNQFPPASELTPDEIVTYTGYNDPNAITSPVNLKINTNKEETIITVSPTSIDYTINIAEYQSIVNIYEAGILIGQGQLDKTGGFSTYLFSPLSDGEHTLYFKVQDLHGNESDASPTFTFTVDTVRPVPPIISSYYVLDDSVINPFETIPDFNKYQMYGTTNNARPYIVGFIKEKAKVNIYLNGNLVGNTMSFSKSLMNESRTEDTYGFSFRLPTLTPGANSITYEILDTAGNPSIMSQAAFIIYETAAPLTPTIYTIDNVGHKIELTSASIITDDSELVFFGNGCRNKTLAKIYEVTGTNPEVETLLAEAVVKKNVFSYKQVLSVGNHTIRFKVKSNDTGLEVVIDKTISIVGTRPTCIITTSDIAGETRYKQVQFTFSEAVNGFTTEDILCQRCNILKETMFGIDPLQTTDNIVYTGVIQLQENYTASFNDGYIKLKESSVYNVNGIYNSEAALTGISNPIIPLLKDDIDYNIPFTPIIHLTVIDKRYGDRLLANGDITDDSTPLIRGEHIGAYFEDTIYAFPLTRSFKLPSNVNYYTEVINACPFDKHRVQILEIQTPSGNIDYKKAFCYLKKSCEYFDYLFFKDTHGFVFPEYDETGALYYRTIEILKTPGVNPEDAPSYSTVQKTILADNFDINPNLRDMLVNRFSGMLQNGEYNLTSNSSQDPVVNYQIITNDESNFTRSSIIKIERYLIIFANSDTVSLIMNINNPIGIEALEPKYFDENFTLDYEPNQELISKKAIFPNYETFEVETPLGDDRHIQYTKINHTDSTVGSYKFDLVNSAGVSTPADKPIIIKLNLFYNDTIGSQQKNGSQLQVPIKPYQVIDNSSLLYFSWLDFSIISTNIEIKNDPISGLDKIYYIINRNKMGASYKINFSTIKLVTFQAYNLLTDSVNNNQYSFSLLNEYNLDYSDTAVCKNISIINESGVPYSGMFYVNKDDTQSKYIRIYPAHPDNAEMYELLEHVQLTIKIDLELTLNSTSTTFSHNYINSDTFQDLKYFKINSILNLDGTDIQDINFVKNEYTPDVYFDSVRQNTFDLSTNKHTSYNEIEDIKTFDSYYSNVFDNSEKIYPSTNLFKFDGLAQIQNNTVIDIDTGPELVVDINVNKEQVYVKDLAYYGLEKSCTIIWDGTKFKIKANGSIYLNDMNFVDEQYPAFDDTIFDAYETDSEVESRLEKRPPRYIWIHTESPSSNISTDINNMNRVEWLGADSSSFFYTKPIGRYVPFIWDDVAESDFWINSNQLESLVTHLGYSLPKTIKGTFRCNGNNLTDLVGGPVITYGPYIAKNNKLTSLTGLATVIGGDSSLYYYDGVVRWDGTTDLSWAKQESIFNNDDLNIWNNSILENNKIGSSLDLSFNAGLDISAFSSLADNYGIVGWNIYIAGTAISYNKENIDTIKSKIKLVGLIYTQFDQTNYYYKVKLDSDPVVETNITEFNDTNFINPVNKFDRDLNIDAEYSTSIKTVTGGSAIYTSLYDNVKLPVTSYVTNKTYHDTSEEIV